MDLRRKPHEGFLRGEVVSGSRTNTTFLMFEYCISDFRYLFEQTLLAATIFWLGAKFLETRAVLSLGFDRIDAARITVRGPDPDNIVWIGRRYATVLEAESVAATLTERMKENGSLA